jgi:3-oxoacyl-[acyl-carrier protein] reductase
VSERGRFLVSGGSGAIGSAVCMALAEQGWQPVVGYAKNEEPARAVARSCGGQALALDLADDASIDAAVAELSESGEPLDGVVLAGSPPPVLATLGRIAPEDLEAQWRINVSGSWRLLAGLIRKVLRKRKQGIVIGVLSQAMGDGERSATSMMGAYIIAKHGMAGLLAAARADYPWLQVASVSPGFTRSPMLEVFDERFLEQQSEQSPIGSPEVVAAQIVDLAAAAWAEEA